MEGWTMIFSLKDEGLLHRIPPSRRLFPLLLAVPFVGFLAGCSEPDQTNARNAATNTTASIQMPPAIVASHTYRCVGGDVLYIDFLADDTSINVKRGPTERKSTRLNSCH